MKKYYFVLFLLLVFSINCYAGQLKEPPVITDVLIYKYFRDIYSNFNNLEVTATNPDGARTGHNGDMVILSLGGNYYLEVCVSSPSGTVWRGVILTDTP